MDNCRKKILFLIGNLESGGVSKSIVSLLNVIDRKKYNVSLWCGSPTGIFYSLLPKDITLINDQKTTLLLEGISGLDKLLQRGYILLFFCSLIRLMLSKINKGYAAWWLSRLIPPVNDEYDLIVDYNGQQQLYYMVDKLKGKKKVTFFHNDYSKWSYYYCMDKKYFPKVDAIYTISDICIKKLEEYFPGQKGKIKLMENISSINLIESMSTETIVDFEAENSILSIGHICKRKGTDIAVEAMHLLRDRGVKFKWYFIGEVKENFDALIAKYSLNSYIEFLGPKINPYPYLKACTIYVHPSRFEGKSIALDEAKILCKPIIVTNFSTVNDQFVDGVNGSICEMTPVSLANSIENLLRDKKLQKKYVDYLIVHKADNSDEVKKIYNLIDSNT